MRKKIERRVILAKGTLLVMDLGMKNNEGIEYFLTKTDERIADNDLDATGILRRSGSLHLYFIQKL